MKWVLFKKEMRSNMSIWIIFAAVLTMYASVVTVMYDPELGKSMNEMAESMPQLFAAFGMENPGQTLLDFLTNYLYGFILIVIPLIFTILLSHRLMARYIDNGSMAYLLQTGASRWQIFITQAIVMLLLQVILLMYTCVVIYVSAIIFFDESLNMSDFMLLNAGLLGLQFFLASLCMASAAVFKTLKYALGVGGGLSVCFVLIQMLSQISEDFDWLKYMTPLTLFNPEGLIVAEQTALVQMAVLYAGSFLFLLIGAIAFRKRDLML